VSQRDPLDATRVQSIFHPSDFSEASEIAFAHALKFALVTRAVLSILHVAARDAHAEWQDFPGVRRTLERWQLIPKGSARSAVADLGIDVRKVVASSGNPVKACLDYLDQYPADLIVLAVHQRDGRMRWLERSVSQPLARAAGQMTLFIPHGVEGFVSRKDGSVALKSILIPVAASPRPHPAIEAASRIIRNLALPAGTVTLLHAGPASDMPAVPIPDDTPWTWQRVTREGEPVERILQTASEVAADLIVMTTSGPDGFLDGLRGTTSERVLRKSRCPVASLPVGSMLG
jgi:nucleotide-binding universal stress UspA family protein